MENEAKEEKDKGEELMEVAMGLIINGGNAKACAMEAIRAAKAGDFDDAEAKMREANESQIQAHNLQTNLLHEEAQGKSNKVTLLMVHAQDHLMNSITFCDLAKEFIDLYKALPPKG